jgi:hypothetical protein
MMRVVFHIYVVQDQTINPFFSLIITDFICSASTIVFSLSLFQSAVAAHLITCLYFTVG